jgi:hypothetical protein
MYFKCQAWKHGMCVYVQIKNKKHLGMYFKYQAWKQGMQIKKYSMYLHVL